LKRIGQESVSSSSGQVSSEKVETKRSEKAVKRDSRKMWNQLRNHVHAMSQQKKNRALMEKKNQ